MADLVKIGLFAGAAYLGWKFFLQPATTAAQASATPQPLLPPAVPPPVIPGTPPIVGANTIDGVYAKLGTVTSGNHTIDEWNYFLMQVIPNFTAPDPMGIFSQAIPGFVRSQQISLPQYWNVMAPWLKANAGLTGLGPRGLGWMAEFQPCEMAEFQEWPWPAF